MVVNLLTFYKMQSVLGNILLQLHFFPLLSFLLGYLEKVYLKEVSSSPLIRIELFDCVLKIGDFSNISFAHKSHENKFNLTLINIF